MAHLHPQRHVEVEVEWRGDFFAASSATSYRAPQTYARTCGVGLFERRAVFLKPFNRALLLLRAMRHVLAPRKAPDGQQVVAQLVKMCSK
jgi:hypothetical protein